MKRERAIIFLLILLIFGINYSWLDALVVDSLSPGDFMTVGRVVDGDTVVADGEKIRLLGINTPEKKEKYSEEAKLFLEGKVLNKSVRLEYGKDKTDRYGRILAYLYVGGENVNQEIVEKGFANPYFPAGRDSHYNGFYNSWKNCNQNFCEKSTDKCASCIVIKEFDHYSQEITFSNQCYFDCSLKGWTLKDEGRKKYTFESIVLESQKDLKIVAKDGRDNSDTLYWNDYTYVWTSSGDSAFLRDSEGHLVVYSSY